MTSIKWPFKLAAALGIAGWVAAEYRRTLLAFTLSAAGLVVFLVADECCERKY